MFCRGAFFISSPVDVSGTGEAGGKEKTPKMGRTMMRSFWVQAEQVCDCHRKMERYLNEERTGMFLDSKDWLRLLVFFLCRKPVSAFSHREGKGTGRKRQHKIIVVVL